MNSTVTKKKTDDTHDAVISTGPAQSRDELEAAYTLAHNAYRRVNLVEGPPDDMRVTLLNALPETRTFVGRVDGTVVSTVTLVPDTELGLPMEDSYGDKLDELRREDRTLVEVTMFADRRREHRRRIKILMPLMKWIYDYAEFIEDADDLCIAIMLRHKGFYTRYLPFIPMSGVRTREDFPNSPETISLRLKIHAVKAKGRKEHRLRKMFLKDRIDTSRLRDYYHMTPADVQYFFLEKSDVFRDASEEQLNIIRKHYERELEWGDSEWNKVFEGYESAR